MSYEDLGYDQFMRRNHKPVVEETPDMVSLRTPQIPSANLSGNVPKSKVQDALDNLVNITDISEATFPSLPSGTGVRITSTISDASDKNRRLLGICESIAYQGSVIGANAIPYGSNAINAGYIVNMFYDLLGNYASDTPVSGLSFTHSVYNNTGSSKTIVWQLRWRYLGKSTAS